jgi:serine phosphatase RsbU (regulator of sigma subunit)
MVVLALLSSTEFLEPVKEYADDILLDKEEARSLISFKVEKLLHLKKREIYSAYLIQEYRKHERDFVLAKHIQEMILQEVPPSWPHMDIDVRFMTTGFIGGDLWDFQVMSNGYLGIFLGDVSGHGVGSALIASMTKILFKTFSREINNPKWFLSRLNEVMVDVLMPVEKFITAFYGIFHNYTLRYTNAGHISPLVYNPESDTFRELYNTSCILGYAKEIPMGLGEIELNPGEYLFLYTDGLTEVQNVRGEMFGIHRLKEFIRKNYDKEKLIDLVMEESHNFAENREIEDDVTLLVIKVK